MNIGFIGYGDASFALSSGFRKEDQSIDLIAYDPMAFHSNFKELIQTRSKSENVQIVNSMEEVCKQTDLLFVAVPATKALEVAKEIKPFISEKHIYVDVTAASPEVKRKAHFEVRKSEALFVDCAMVGPLLVEKHKVPMLISGPGVEVLAEKLKNYHMNLKIISGNPGDSTAIKLVRSIYMKGFATLNIEMLQAARTFGVEDTVIEGIGHTMDGDSYESSMNRMVTGTSIHAERRSAELDGSITMLEEANIHSVMATAVKEKLDFISSFGLRDSFSGEAPEQWEDVIDSMSQSKTKR
ncbi:NAD(P)-dependent oxidoreductase [Salicibibacter cibarius]|uniref:NAD(P)-dependent oxidoreductase n=1 Tax=Salicibibacter cibarius TaxID=2743000 RepID=A0A7T6Z6J1_9BACI|nr:DUF1932 domain-containing protein [Salicibibacter cibarius]QQK77721.1 NAD(P)-dependent oxidoreductase [Salicibibacter cibarius]